MIQVCGNQEAVMQLYNLLLAHKLSMLGGATQGDTTHTAAVPGVMMSPYPGASRGGMARGGVLRGGVARGVHAHEEEEEEEEEGARVDSEEDSWFQV